MSEALGPEADQHSVAGKVVIVTGAGRGIGRGIVHHLGRHGARVVLAEWKVNRLEAVTAELAEAGIDHLGVECNIMERASIEAMVGRTVERYGRVDGIVNNAQTFRPVAALAALSEDDLDVFCDSGIKGTLWAMQAVHPVMQAQGWGRIVNFASSNGMTGAAGYGAYNASKEAIRALTRTAAREWGRDGIVVNCVCPASAGHRRPPEERFRREAYVIDDPLHPMGRDGDPDLDIGAVVQFLCTDAVRYMTGQTLMVDGGYFCCS
jgi:NAD(P)-dependent dehydrogenase (short-subunit alcohol dehydrogenase family)